VIIYSFDKLVGDLKFKRQGGAWFASRLRNTKVLCPDNMVRRLTEQHFAMRIQQKRNEHPQNGMLVYQT